MIREQIPPEQFSLLALLYIRQSTMRQVLENTESARRQYGLRDRIVNYGWPEANVVIIDEDQGRSGAFVGGREGFQRLMAEVAAGHVGLVAGLEVSRLCRDNADWAQLVKVCALTATLLMDEQGLYDPRDVNDGIILDFKGGVAKAEYRLIINRCQGAIRHRAQRGEFRMHLPTGFVYDAQGRPVIDPDLQVQETIRHFFAAYHRLGTARGVVRAFRAEGLKIPVCRWGTRPAGELTWEELTQARAVSLLHQPRYAGIYCYGRKKSKRTVEGRLLQRHVPREKWMAFLPGMHEGYISPEEFERNQQRLREALPGRGTRLHGPPREGSALLQGLVLCGICGRGMSVRYDGRVMGGTAPIYYCRGDSQEAAGRVCQFVQGERIDEAVEKLLLEQVSPLAAEKVLQVHRELQARQEEADRLRRRGVERARYEAELAHRRYLQVDPENRLVAASLEKTWNEKLQELGRAQQEYETACQRAREAVTPKVKETLEAMVQDFASVWKDRRTPWREKKRMARLLLEDVTLIKGRPAKVHVRFRGGLTRTLDVELPLPWKLAHATPREVVEAIRAYGEGKSSAEVARFLNERGLRTGMKQPFNKAKVNRLRRLHHLSAGCPVAGIPPRAPSAESGSGVTGEV